MNFHFQLGFPRAAAPQEYLQGQTAMANGSRFFVGVATDRVKVALESVTYAVRFKRPD